MSKKRESKSKGEKKPKAFEMAVSSFKGLPKPLRQMETESDWANAVATFLPILNSDPTLAMMFLTDPYGLCKDAGIEIGDMLRSHLEKRVELFKYNDSKLYRKLKSGERLKGVKELRLVPTKQLKEGVTINEMLDSVKQTKGSATAFGPRFPRPLPVKRNSQNGGAQPRSLLFTNAFAVPIPTTRGWTVVMQIGEDFISDLFEKIMETHYNMALFAALLTGGQRQDFPGLAEPWYVYTGWLATTFVVSFNLEYVEEDEPGITLESVASDEVRARFKISGNVTLADQTVPFEGTIQQPGEIVRDDDNQRYFIDFTEDSPIVNLDGEDDFFLEILVAFAVYNYFSTQFPTMPLFTLADTPPFLIFDQSAVFSVDALGNMNALTWTFGDSSLRVDPYDRYILRPGNNLALGQSAAALHFTIRSELPELPMVPDQDPNILLRTIDLELRNGAWEKDGVSGQGYVEVTGTGRYTTCDCYPDVEFSYSINIGVHIDDNGNLQEVVISSGVGLPAWMYIVHGLILGALGIVVAGPAGGIAMGSLGLIGTAIAEAVAGSEVAGQVGSAFSVEMNIEQQLNDSFDALEEGTAGLFSFEASVRQVQITPNGIFFFGNIEADAVWALPD